MNEVDAIFDAIGKASAFIHKQDEINEAKERLADIEKKECGMCQYWMKSSCKPEKEFGQFKSGKSFPCKDFKREQIYEDIIIERKEKLKMLRKK